MCFVKKLLNINHKFITIDSNEKLVKCLELDSPRKQTNKVVFMSNHFNDIRKASLREQFFESTHRIDNSV